MNQYYNKNNIFLILIFLCMSPDFKHEVAMESESNPTLLKTTKLLRKFLVC